MSSGDDFQKRKAELDRAHRRRRTPKYGSLALHWLWRSLKQPARAVHEPMPTVRSGQIAVAFAGERTALIRYEHLTIVCDPVLRRWLGPVHREVEPGLSPGDLSDTDLILISNRDPNSLDVKSLARLPRSCTIVVPPGCSAAISSLGFDRLIEVGVGQSFQQGGVSVHTTPVARDTDTGLSFIIRGNGPTLYYCSSSAYFPGFSDIGSRFAPDIALLPIGGYCPNSFRRRQMSPLDSLYAFEDLQARILIPISHGAFARSYEKLHDPRTWLAKLVEERSLESFVVPLKPGESQLFTNPARARRPTPHAHMMGADLLISPRVRTDFRVATG
jgi:L-ascorbate metabolism protein UlaG (beta-lactamase superfamily)